MIRGNLGGYPFRFQTVALLTIRLLVLTMKCSFVIDSVLMQIIITSPHDIKANI